MTGSSYQLFLASCTVASVYFTLVCHEPSLWQVTYIRFAIQSCVVAFASRICETYCRSSCPIIIMRNRYKFCPCVQQSRAGAVSCTSPFIITVVNVNRSSATSLLMWQCNFTHVTMGQNFVIVQTLMTHLRQFTWNNLFNNVVSPARISSSPFCIVAVHGRLETGCKSENPN